MNAAESQNPFGALLPTLSVGRYALYGEIATGGMATVHFGRMTSHGGFSRTVAIKRMRRDIAMDPDFVAMFLDEARLTSRIEHPNVVATIDVVAEAGEVFLVMEYVRGESLQRLRRAAKAKRETIPIPIAVAVLCQVLTGLHAAHDAVGEDGRPLGIIHRDVSPQNILVGEDGIARITDFGIAKAESRLQITHDGQMKGKLPYMAPEQLAGLHEQRLDRRLDIYSAAVVLWELLAGRILFRGDHPGETIARVLRSEIPPLTSIRSDVSSALDAVIRRALSRDVEVRQRTAEEFALELEEAAEALASQRVVGAWVTRLAGEVLESRLKYVRDMESSSSVRGGPGDSLALFPNHVTSPSVPRRAQETPPGPQLPPVPDDAQASKPPPWESTSTLFRHGAQTHTSTDVLVRAMQGHRTWPFVAIGVAIVAVGILAISTVVSNMGNRAEAQAIAPPIATLPVRAAGESAGAAGDESLPPRGEQAPVPVAESTDGGDAGTEGAVAEPAGSVKVKSRATKRVSGPHQPPPPPVVAPEPPPQERSTVAPPTPPPSSTVWVPPLP